MTESSIQKDIQVSVSVAGARVSRNNCGSAWIGSSVKHIGSDVLISNARPIKYGVFNPGGSDLIGILPRKITQDMVGSTIGIFLCIEVKSEKGTVKEHQQDFINMVNSLGGRAFVARSVSEAIDNINK